MARAAAAVLALGAGLAATAGLRLAGGSALAAGAPPPVAAVSPPDRPATDPRSLESSANPEAAPVPVEDLFFSRAVLSPAWSPDGKEIAFTTNLTGRHNLWKVPAAGGWPIQLSRSDDVETGAVWSPDGRWLLFHHDEAGNEIGNLFAIPSSGGAAINLSNTREISETSPSWSPDGTLVAFAMKPTTSSIQDLGLLDWRTKASRNLTRETDKDHLWSVAAWSPDGKVLYAGRGNVDGLDSDVMRIDLATGALANLTPHQGERKAPLLVLQGANDVRDPKEEAEQAVAVLERQGKIVASHYYPDEGHGFKKRENQIDALSRTVAWFDRYLKPTAPAGRPGGTR